MISLTAMLWAIPASAAEPAPDSGLHCLLAIASLHGVTADEAELRRHFGKQPFNRETLLLAARSLGLRGQAIKQAGARLARAPLPAIAKDRRDDSYFVVAQYRQRLDKPAQLLIQYLGQPPRMLSESDFLQRWTGTLLFFTSEAMLIGDMARFDFSWLAPALGRCRRVLGEVPLISRVTRLIKSNPACAITGAKTRRPRLTGAIEFDQVSFRYKPDAPDVLRGVSLKVEPGQVIGIVGRSGSGKSTLTRLVQRLHVPHRGRVLVDGQDIADVDTASLRRQVGVVLQDNELLPRSIRDNIALADPTMPIEGVIRAARLAGAHDVIRGLPDGYDTRVGEHGTGLSCGQRQRIAIARALIGDPRILILDEATSALDDESEKVIRDRMRAICEGRTVLIISHRLSAVRDADRIVVMERGEVAEFGTHEELLANPRGIFTRLNALQHGSASELIELTP